HLGAETMAAYMSTKAGAIGLTRSLARDLGKRGIRANVITPGWILTDRQKAEHVTDEVVEMLLKEQSVPELNEPDEVAELALFLASDASRVITGQEIIADRGWRFD
ncbi:MAG: SDR family oxidoreductase, partial [Verrucomicrobiota bacterium]